MHVTYSSLKLRELCECGASAQRVLGSSTSVLQRVLADMDAAENFNELPPLYDVIKGQGNEVVIRASADISLKIAVLSGDSEQMALKVLGITYD